MLLRQVTSSSQALLILRAYRTPILIAIVAMLLIDIFFGQSLLQLVNAPGAYKSYGLRISHDRYHHTLSPNYQGTDEWGTPYPYCTDSGGFRANCGQGTSIDGPIDYALMGDSMVEGLGVVHEQTIAGVLTSLTKQKVVNFSVSSYSPSIHIEKYKHYAAQGLEIKHLIVFFDISDIDDEANIYVRDSEGRIVDRKVRSEISLLERKLRHRVERLIPLTWHGLSVLKKALKNTGRSQAESWSLQQDRNSVRAGWTYLYGERDAAFQAEIMRGFSLAIGSIKELAALARERGTNIYVVLYPWPHQLAFESDDQTLIEDLSIKNLRDSGVNLINLFPAFRDERRKLGAEALIEKLFLAGDTHFSPFGHEFMARQILTKLPKSTLTPVILQ